MVNNWYQSLFFFLTLDDSVERIYNPCRTQLSSHRHVRGRFNAMRRTRWSVAALSVGSRADARVTAWTRVNISFHARPFPSNNVVNVIYKLSLILSSVKIKLVAFRGDHFFFFSTTRQVSRGHTQTTVFSSVCYSSFFTVNLFTHRTCELVLAFTTRVGRKLFFVAGLTILVARHVRGWLNIGSGANTRVSPAT